MQTALIIALVISVATLSVLLVARIRSQRRELVALAELAPARISELIEGSPSRAGLQDVTAHIAKVLEAACGCRQLAFLRKHGDSLEFEHGHGLNGIGEGWRLACSPGLMDRLKQSHVPTSVSRIIDLLPAGFTEMLKTTTCDLCFPVFWGNQLHGLYFFSENELVRLPSFQLAVAAVAQTLAAAYHLNWYRDQHGELQKRVTALQAGQSEENSKALSTPNGLLKLIRHHDSETLVGRIVDEVGREIGLDRYTFFFAPQSDPSVIQVHEQGVRTPIEAPRRELFEQLLARVDPEQATEVGAIERSDETAGIFLSVLQQAGMKYLATFPLSNERMGLLAWDDDKAADEVFARLRLQRQPVSALMANAESFEEILGLSYTDGLTGLANHRFFVRRLDEEIDRARRYSRSLALIIFDLDELKLVNDNHGHQAGDSVLRQMGKLLKGSVRSNDIVARYGGDEFCIIMPESDRATCARFIRRFQRKISGTKFRISQLDEGLTCTISQGGAVFPDHAETSEQLVYAADMALLGAKSSGRNGYQLR